MVSIGRIVEVKNMQTSEDLDVLVTADEQKRFLILSRRSTTSKKSTNFKYKDQKKYRVRVPLLHGVGGDGSSVPDNELPWCTYCPLPGSQNTSLLVDDLVYTAIVDFKFENLVILGCVTSQQQKSTSGASLERVQYFSMADDAPTRLSSNILIGPNNNCITFKNLLTLQGFEGKLSDHVWGLRNGGLGVSIVGEAGKKQARENLGIPNTVLISQSLFEKLDRNNLLEKNTIYYIWMEDDQDEEDLPTSSGRGGRDT